jgi:hypothetical protein
MQTEFKHVLLQSDALTSAQWYFSPWKRSTRSVRKPMHSVRRLSDGAALTARGGGEINAAGGRSPSYPRRRRSALKDAGEGAGAGKRQRQPRDSRPPRHADHRRNIQATSRSARAINTPPATRSPAAFLAWCQLPASSAARLAGSSQPVLQPPVLRAVGKAGDFVGGD